LAPLRKLTYAQHAQFNNICEGAVFCPDLVRDADDCGGVWVSALYELKRDAGDYGVSALYELSPLQYAGQTLPIIHE